MPGLLKRGCILGVDTAAGFGYYVPIGEGKLQMGLDLLGTRSKKREQIKLEKKEFIIMRIPFHEIRFNVLTRT